MTDKLLKNPLDACLGNNQMKLEKYRLREIERIGSQLLTIFMQAGAGRVSTA
jgi:hypothetical protein